MKNVLVTTSLVALLLTSAAQASDITIKWKVTGNSLGSGYLPKVASDGIENVVTIGESATGLSALEDQLGYYAPLSKAQVSWTGIAESLYGPTMQIGHAPSIALAYDGKNNYDTAIEVHQGAQDSESALWFQLGTNAPPSFSAISWGTATQLGPGHLAAPVFCYPASTCPVVPFDNGYNPTVAADLNGSDLKYQRSGHPYQCQSGQQCRCGTIGLADIA